MKLSLIPYLAMTILLWAGSWYLKPHEVDFSQEALRFSDVSRTSGCSNTHSKVSLSPQFDNIMPWLSSVGAAVCAGDFDNDGLIDFYVTNSGRNTSNRLFHNIGSGKFEDIAVKAGVADCNRDGASMDAIFFDYDNDGDEDLYVVKWGAPNILFENQGDGTFKDVTARAGVGYWGYANGVIAFDYDRDGLLDILVANYFPDSVVNPATGRLARNDLWNPVTSRIMHTTFTHAVNGGRNVLYKNMGNGTFKDVTLEVGLGHTGWSLDVGSGDLNNDGWPDLYVANDFGADELYFNTGASEFPPRFRIVIDPSGHPGIGNDWWKGMNVDIADVDGNGRLDIYVTNILARRYKTDEGNMLWLNFPDQSMIGGCKFMNVSSQVRTNDGGWGWGGKFCDFNNDGLMDIFTVNGFTTGKDSTATYWYQLQEMVTQTKNNAADTKDWPVMGDRDLSGYEPSRLFLQVPQRADNKTAPMTFVERATACGITDLYNGRGIALADYDNDGAVDMYIANQGTPNCLYHNELLTKSQTLSSDRPAIHWIGFFLVGEPSRARRVGDRLLASSRDAIGARVEVWSHGVRQLRELDYCDGFASESERRIVVGLGNSTSIDRVEITWPSGRKEQLQGSELVIDQYHSIVEGNTTPHLAKGAQP
ncbi:MAG: CRTAC1 family protein [Ignavibacteriae bacterium]|nr:CRTAC1 family protein [Ignavibacteria bacterium]MBI3364783.1 CRTAC1 family protein [Ignavibacteriota bacterium]